MEKAILKKLQDEYGREDIQILSLEWTEPKSEELSLYDWIVQSEFKVDSKVINQTLLVSKSEGDVYLSEYDTQYNTEEDVARAIEEGLFW